MSTSRRPAKRFRCAQKDPGNWSKLMTEKFVLSRGKKGRVIRSAKGME